MTLLIGAAIIAGGYHGGSSLAAAYMAFTALQGLALAPFDQFSDINLLLHPVTRIGMSVVVYGLWFVLGRRLFRNRSS